MVIWHYIDPHGVVDYNNIMIFSLSRFTWTLDRASNNSKLIPVSALKIVFMHFSNIHLLKLSVYSKRKVVINQSIVIGHRIPINVNYKSPYTRVWSNGSAEFYCFKWYTQPAWMGLKIDTYF